MWCLLVFVPCCFSRPEHPPQLAFIFAYWPTWAYITSVSYSRKSRCNINQQKTPIFAEYPPSSKTTVHSRRLSLTKVMSKLRMATYARSFQCSLQWISWTTSYILKSQAGSQFNHDTLTSNSTYPSNAWTLQVSAQYLQAQTSLPPIASLLGEFTNKTTVQSLTADCIFSSFSPSLQSQVRNMLSSVCYCTMDIIILCSSTRYCSNYICFLYSKVNGQQEVNRKWPEPDHHYDRAPDHPLVPGRNRFQTWSKLTLGVKLSYISCV